MDRYLDVFEQRGDRFLDQFVGNHNDLGHHGEYLGVEPSGYRSWTAGRAELVRREVHPCPWRFSDNASLAAFC